MGIYHLNVAVKLINISDDLIQSLRLMDINY